MPSPSVPALNYKTVFHNVGRRFANLDSLSYALAGAILTINRKRPIIIHCIPPGRPLASI